MGACMYHNYGIYMYLKEWILKTIFDTPKTVSNEKYDSLILFRLWQTQHLNAMNLAEISTKGNLHTKNQVASYNIIHEP